MASSIMCSQFCILNRIYILKRSISNNSFKGTHPFREQISKYGVFQYLSNNILFKDDDIVVFNKPANVAKTTPLENVNNSRFGETVYIDDMMEDIAKLVPDFKDLKIVKFPERYTSGIMIFAGSSESAVKMEKIKRRAKGGTELCNTYLTITQGRPIQKNASCKLAVKIEEGKGTRRKVPIIKDSWSNQDVKKERLKLFRISHSVLSEGPMTSLTQVSTSSTAKNSLRLYFSTKLLSPILGDAIFSSRVRDLMGVSMLLDPWSDVANSHKTLPGELLKVLGLTSNDTSLVPLFLHLAEVRLPGYSKNRDLVLYAPSPPTFQWACEQLNLNLQLEGTTLKSIEAG